jgi:hypothetical protein
LQSIQISQMKKQPKLPSIEELLRSNECWDWLILHVQVSQHIFHQ